ncbi:MAG TPA: dihydroxy-acid dehydratase, partial [Nakamurella sp.]
SAMVFRNLISMDLEESLRANPLDGVVLLSGCDKTTPAYLMGAASVDLPTIMLTGGPMLNGKYRGTDIGSGTSVWRLTEAFRAGEISQADLSDAEGCMARSNGHCMTMGTASTMSCLTEILGLMLPGSAAWPANDSRRKLLAHQSGRRIVDMVGERLTMSAVIGRSSFENAIRANAALGGSTNAVVHLLALAGRLGVSLALEDFDTLAQDIPTLVDLMPAGRFLMEDFAYAGGVGALVAELGPMLDGAAGTVTGASLAENYSGAECFNREVIRPLAAPVKPAGTHIAVLFGSLAPAGAVIKQAAAAPELMRHRGKARVWDRVEDYLAEAERDDCDIEPDDIIVIRYSGPRGYPGMPEIANVALPKRLLQQGIRDMIRISDARMSGTSYGTVVLHVAPEAAVGGPLALVRDGDTIVLDVPARRLDLAVDEDELARRAAEWMPRAADGTDRGYLKLYVDTVDGADTGADFPFLRGGSGAAVPRRAF